jgi:fatty-acyl-CoA synthase
MDVTSTFKHAKSDLVREGYDPGVTSDALYVSDPGKRRYVTLDAALYERLQSDEIRL